MKIFEGMFDPTDFLLGMVREYVDCGDCPDELFIVFDGHAESEDGKEDESRSCYAVFVHKDSADEGFVFPERDVAAGTLISYPEEEACFFVWLGGDDERDISVDTGMDMREVSKTLMVLASRYGYGPN